MSRCSIRSPTEPPSSRLMTILPPAVHCRRPGRDGQSRAPQSTACPVARVPSPPRSRTVLPGLQALRQCRFHLNLTRAHRQVQNTHVFHVGPFPFANCAAHPGRDETPASELTPRGIDTGRRTLAYAPATRSRGGNRSGPAALRTAGERSRSLGPGSAPQSRSDGLAVPPHARSNMTRPSTRAGPRGLCSTVVPSP